MSDLATALYTALLSDPARMKQFRRMQYRCDTERHCLLLDVVVMPDAVLLFQPRYKYSPEQNTRRSSEAGRRKNTVDGDRRWKGGGAFFIGSSALGYPDDTPTPQLSVSCDHVLDHALLATDFRDDRSAGHADVRVRRDGSRYAVS